jgi:hypothetical protein
LGQDRARQVTGLRECTGAVMRYYATYFDRNYVDRALALIHSMQEHEPDSHLFALCLDEESFSELAELQSRSITPVTLRELEPFDVELTNTKPARSIVEYYWTCGPAFLSYLLTINPQVDLLTYLDSDMYFFSPPQPIFDELTGHSVGVIEHRFHRKHRHYEKFGRFNVGWVTFRRDSEGLACLAWWRRQCIDWCFDFVDSGRFADQKYLDEWPHRFKGVKVIEHKGANLGPWNIGNYRLFVSGGNVMVDDQPLIIFHFHGMKQLNASLFDTNLGRYRFTPGQVTRARIFYPYIERLRQIQKGRSQGRLHSLRRKESAFHLKSLSWLYRLILGLIHRSYIIVPRHREN